MNLTTFQEEVLNRYKEENGGNIDLTDAFFITSSTTEAHAIGKDEGKQEGFVLGLKRALELLPDEIPSPKRQCLNAESHLFGQCFECAKNKGFNRARTEIETALSAELTSLEKRV